MAMVDVDGSSLLVDSAQIDWLDLRVGGYLAPSLHSSSEPGKLSQWLTAMMTHDKYITRSNFHHS